jgi:hypothetical protein
VVEYDFMFGDTWCLITISADPGDSGTSRFTAQSFVLGHRGRFPRRVCDRDTRPVTFRADAEASALALTSEYLEDRFGPRRAAPAPTTTYVTSYLGGGAAEGLPLPDLRPDPVVVLALERILRGDEVMVTEQGARLARQPLSALSSDVFLATAAEDIDKGRHGRVRQIHEETRVE